MGTVPLAYPQGVHATASQQPAYSGILSTLPTILPSTKGRGARSSEYSSNSSIFTSGQKLLKKNLEKEHKVEMKKSQSAKVTGDLHC